LPRNAARISPSPTMTRPSARANDVVDFRLAWTCPWKNRQTRRSPPGTCPGGDLRTVRCDNKEESRKPNVAHVSQKMRKLPNTPLACASREIGTKMAMQWSSGDINPHLHVADICCWADENDQPWRREEAV
jgi:hypothetical protein